MEYKECKYRLPCGYCERTKELCIFVQDTKSIECQHRWVWSTELLSYKCVKCGKEEYRGAHGIYEQYEQ